MCVPLISQKKLHPVHNLTLKTSQGALNENVFGALFLAIFTTVIIYLETQHMKCNF